MPDLTRKPPDDAPPEAHEQYLSDFMSALDDGLEAVRIAASGGAPDADTLDGYAQALEALRIGAVARGGWMRPTEEDVRAARHLAQLVREGAPPEALTEAALRVHAVTAKPDEAQQRAGEVGIEDVTGLDFIQGAQAAWTVVSGGVPDLERLDRLAVALDVLVRAMTEGTLPSVGSEMTDEDVRDARRLVKLVREGAPREELTEAALRVYCRNAGRSVLVGLRHVLPWLGGEATAALRHFSEPAPGAVEGDLAKAVSFFERCNSAVGFTPTPDDLARLRRLQEIAAAENGAELVEKRRLAQELLARLPTRTVEGTARHDG
jgi:hypothetical protein